MSVGDVEHQAERMSCGIAIHPEVVPVRYVGHPRGTECEHLLLGGIDVLDLDVEVELLGTVRVGETRRLMVGRQLEGYPAAGRLGEHRPRLVLGVELAAQNL